MIAACTILGVICGVIFAQILLSHVMTETLTDYEENGMYSSDLEDTEYEED